MDKDMDKEMERIKEQIVDDLRYTQRGEDVPNRGLAPNLTPERKRLIFVGAAILLVIVLIAIFSRGGGKVSSEDLASMQARLSKLEERIRAFEGIQNRVFVLEKWRKEVPHTMAGTDRPGGAVIQILNELTQRLDQMEKRISSIAAKPGAPRAIERKPSPLLAGRYHEVQPGDTLYQIAQEYNISLEELCRLNNITPEELIYPGQKLLVTPRSPQ